MSDEIAPDCDWYLGHSFSDKQFGEDTGNYVITVIAEDVVGHQNSLRAVYAARNDIPYNSLLDGCEYWIVIKLFPATKSWQLQKDFC